MIVNNKEFIFNINNLICLPKEEMKNYEIYEYNFGYVYLLEANDNSTNNLIQFVKKNNINELVLVDYKLEYEYIIEKLRETVNISAIYTKEMATLSIQYNLDVYNGIINLLKNDKIRKIGCLNINSYEILKKNFNNCFYINLDIKVDEKNNVEDDSILIANNWDNVYHSYYNGLSATKMLNKKVAILEENEIVKKFNEVFNIDYQVIKNINEFSGDVGLYVNFSDTDIIKFLELMDKGILCIVGNNSFLNNNEKLGKYLVVKSKDNINEISQKISDAKINKGEIFKEYKLFREEYSESSKQSIKAFLKNNMNNLEKDKVEAKKLLTIGIPVYNVEKYIKECLESILIALPKENIGNIEIIIVNDGSTDNSEYIINEYVKKYPELIKYIKQENHGLGNVRNVILKNANGKYIASIDSDDTINKEFFNKVIPYLKEDVDIVLCDWLSINNKNKFITSAFDTQLTEVNDYKKILYSTIMPSTCNKVVKKSLYNNIGLSFIEGLKFEDLGTNPVIMLNAEKIKYIAQPYYEYKIRENSIMRTKVEYNMIDVLKRLNERIDKYVRKEFNEKEFKAYIYYWRIEESVINLLYKLDKDKRKEMIKYIYDNINNILMELYDNNEYVNFFVNRLDDEIKKYILERNKHILDKTLESFLEEVINKKEYKILTPALILYG